MKSIKTIAAALVLALGAQTAYAQVNVDASAFIVGHPDSGRILASNNSQTLLEPASLTKMMTLYILFERLESGELTLDQRLPISEAAWRKGGSKMFLEVGNTVAIKDLIPGIAVASGNDACIVVAEAIAGTEEGFADLMNDKAKDLGLTNTNFENASGWPHPDMKTTAADIYKLASRLMSDFPQYYDVFSKQQFSYNGIRQFNRNGLLGKGLGVDGMKTGHVESAGYHLASSAERKNYRLVSVVMGTNSMTAREEESLKALGWAFGMFDMTPIVKEGQIITQAPVWLGADDEVGLVAGESLNRLLSRSEHDDVSVKAVFNAPIPAPVKEGAQVGYMIISAPGVEDVRVPLLTANSVEEKGFGGKLKSRLQHLIGM